LVGEELVWQDSTLGKICTVEIRTVVILTETRPSAMTNFSRSFALSAGSLCLKLTLHKFRFFGDFEIDIKFLHVWMIFCTRSLFLEQKLSI
jgi:hypothetical protein